MKEQHTNFSTSEAINIIDLIRKMRNDLIKDFLDERNLLSYLSKQFRVPELSAIKMEFIKKDLKELLISPVNVQLYSPIIEDFKTSGTASLSEGNEKLFYKELEDILKKHIY